jgi:hypothetical protein
MTPAQLAWITLAIRASRFLYLAAVRALNAAQAGKDPGKPVPASRGRSPWFRPSESAPARKAERPPRGWFWFSRPEPPAPPPPGFWERIRRGWQPPQPPPPPPGLAERIRTWWRARAAAPPPQRKAGPKPSAAGNGRMGTLGAFAVLLVWLPAVAVAVSAPELFDRLLPLAAASGGLLWLMRSGGSQEDDA